MVNDSKKGYIIAIVILSLIIIALGGFIALGIMKQKEKESKINLLIMIMKMSSFG